MYSRLLAAGIIAALPLAFTPAASAADLGDEPPPPRYGSYKDDDAGPPPPRRYSEQGCVPKHAVRERLVDDGWRDFRNPEIRGETALFTASRPSGVRFLLRVDRCSGEIIRARRLTPRYEEEDAYAPRDEYWGPRIGFYAYGPRRWGYRHNYWR